MDWVISVRCVCDVGSQNAHWIPSPALRLQRTNGSGALPAACVAALPPRANVSQCFFAENVALTMKTPTFALNSEYDSFQVWGMPITALASVEA